MEAFFTLIYFLIFLVGFVTIIVLAIGVWNGYIIRKVQELRQRKAKQPKNSRVYYDLKRQEEDNINLIPVRSVRHALMTNDKAIIDSVMHDHSVEVLGFTIVLAVGGRFEHEKIHRADGTFGTKTVLESDGILGVFVGLLRRIVESGKEIWKSIFY
jgi:uncharacterized ion transporter superfamily protein YfcC